MGDGVIVSDATGNFGVARTTSFRGIIPDVLRRNPFSCVILGLDPRIYLGFRSESVTANCRRLQILGSSPRMTSSLLEQSR